MDHISEFDIRLEKEAYYAGETIHGHVILHTTENFKLRSIRVSLRGQAHAEWKVLVSGDRRSVKDDQYFVDERLVIWGQDSSEGPVPILPRGKHQFPFRFNLPESALPCSFESRTGCIRYYIKATVDRPYASPPQGFKYFTLIGPHIDCMDEQYLKPMVGNEIYASCCFCCTRYPVELSAQLERSAYVCGESIKLRAAMDNRGLEKAWLKVKLTQYVEFFIDRGVLGASREQQKMVLEYKGDPVQPGSAMKWDSAKTMVLPVCPPTLLGVCRLIQIYYVLKVSVEFEKAGEDLQMHFPITVATVPFRIPNSVHQPQIKYGTYHRNLTMLLTVCGDNLHSGKISKEITKPEPCAFKLIYLYVYKINLNMAGIIVEVAAEHVEGGCYIGPEFLLGQVYDGSDVTQPSALVLYRPVYVCTTNDCRGHEH